MADNLAQSEALKEGGHLQDLQNTEASLTFSCASTYGVFGKFVNHRTVHFSVSDTRKSLFLDVSILQPMTSTMKLPL